MSKSTKNIILSGILIVMVISSYFTGYYLMKNNTYILQSPNNMQIQENRKQDEVIKDDNENNKEESSQDERDNTTEEQSKTDIKNKSKHSFNRRVIPNNNRDNFQRMNKKQSPLFYILFAFENIIIGIIITCIILNNKKEEIKLIK